MAAALIHGGDIYGRKPTDGADFLDYSSNVNPLGVPTSVKAAMAAAAETADRYPDPLCRGLRKAIAQSEGINENNIFCSNGAADIIYRVTAAKKPKKAIVTAPCFAEYELALKNVGCEITEYPLSADNGFVITEEISDLLVDGIDMIFICNPNNPTGKLIDKPVLDKIVKRCIQNDMLLVVDECFLGFCDDYSLRSLKSYANNSKNIVVINAFTKLYGMAGVRLGWCVCSDRKLTDAMFEAGQPWAVSSIAQAAGIAALSEKRYVAESRVMTVLERDYLTEQLKKLGVKVINSDANFIMFYSCDKRLAEKTESQGILIRDCSNFSGIGKGWYRIAVKQRQQNERLIAAVKKALEEDI